MYFPFSVKECLINLSVMILEKGKVKRLKSLQTVYYTCNYST